MIKEGEAGLPEFGKTQQSAEGLKKHSPAGEPKFSLPSIHSEIDAAEDLDSYFAQFYDPGKIPALKHALEKIGVELHENSDAFLEQKGIAAGFAFDPETGQIAIYLKSNPRFREVFHELVHVRTYMRLLKESGDN